jgi:hypothetical protein
MPNKPMHTEPRVALSEINVVHRGPVNGGVRRVVRFARQTELSRWHPAEPRRPANIDKNVVQRENRSVYSVFSISENPMNRRIVPALLVLFGLSVGVAAHAVSPPPAKLDSTPNLDGWWHNQLGSEMEVKYDAKARTLSGRYRTNPDRRPTRSTRSLGPSTAT